MLKQTIRFLLSRIAEVITVGFPFCGFKILSGIVIQSHANSVVSGVGFVLLALGAVDLLVNLINFAALVFLRRRLLETCTFALILKLISKNASPNGLNFQDLGNSVDVLLSFVLVAVMIAFGKLALLSPHEIFIWNLCVIFNVLGAGLSRFGQSIKAHLGA